MIGSSIFAIGGLATSYPKSIKVAMVPNSTSSNGGSLYTDTTWPNGDSFSFTNVAVADIANGNIADPIATGGYDTVVLMSMAFDFGAAWSDPDFSSRITSFLNGGGRVIIYTSESTSATAFSNFIYPFTVDTPGQTGSRSGTLTNLANDTLSSSNPADISYVDLAAITSQTDAVGDLTVMTSYNTNWYIDLFGVNMRGTGGPAHTYAFYGPGLIIFNGLDIDNAQGPPSNTNGRTALNMLWWRELSAQNLGAGANVNGLTLDPASAVNPVNTTHTVTATVRNIQNNTVTPNVQVYFNVTSGPNFGLLGQATTNSSGQAIFSWNSSVVGTDVLRASILNSNPGEPNITSTATKTWVLPGNLSVSVDPGNWTMDIGQTKLFTATPNGGTFNYTSYQWYINGTAENGQVVSTYLFTPTIPGFYQISATVTDTNTTSPQSDYANVTVNPAPTISITPIGPLTIEAGQTQLFTANYNGGSQPDNFQWFVNAAKVGTNDTSYTYWATGNPVSLYCELTDNASVPVTVRSNVVLINQPSAGTPTPGGGGGGGGGTTIAYVEVPGPTPTPTIPDTFYLYLNVIAPQSTIQTKSIPIEISVLTNGTLLESWFNIKNGTKWVYATNQTYSPPITIYDGDKDFFKVDNGGSGGTFPSAVVSNDILGTKIVITHDTRSSCRIYHTFATLNLSNKTVVHFKIQGDNGGGVFDVAFLAPDRNNYYHFALENNFTGSQDFYVPISSMTQVGSPSLKTVKSIEIDPKSTTFLNTIYIQSISMIDDLQPGFSDGTYTLYAYAKINESFLAGISVVFSVVPPTPPVYPFKLGWLEIAVIGIMSIFFVIVIILAYKFFNKKKNII
jgi:hypothetical protein